MPTYSIHHGRHILKEMRWKSFWRVADLVLMVSLVLGLLAYPFAFGFLYAVHLLG